MTTTHEKLWHDGLAIGETWIAPRGPFEGRRIVSDLSGTTRILDRGQDSRAAAHAWAIARFTQPITTTDIHAAHRAIATMRSHDEDPETIERQEHILHTRVLIAIANNPTQAWALARATLTPAEEA